MRRIATILRLAALGVLLAFLLVPQRFAPLFAPLTQGGAPPIYDQGNLAQQCSRLVSAASSLLSRSASWSRAPAARNSCRCRARW
jgi:hypothetical protein